MSEESTTPHLVELVRRSHEAGGQRDADAICALLAPDCVYRPIATFTDSQVRRGPDEVRQFLVEWWDAWAEDATWRLDTTRAYGDALVCLTRFSGRARASGLETVGGVFQVFRFRGGRVSQIEDFTDGQAAIAAAEGTE
jgi:ketosteroid isomerase-like protein